MARDEQKDLAARFRQRHLAPLLLLLPNAWDAMSARVFAAAGYDAIATTSAGVAWALGYPDGEAAPWPEVVAATARIVRCVRVPVTADIEAGFADTPAVVAAHVVEIIGAGAVGINLEDSILGAVPAIRSLDEAAARIGAAREAAEKSGVPIVINARTDLYYRTTGDADHCFAETVRRAKAYLAAGADCIYPFGLRDVALIGALVAAVGAPINVTGRRGMPSVSELAALGVARVTIASTASLMAMSVTAQVADELRRSGRFDGLDPAIKHPEAQKLFR